MRLSRTTVALAALLAAGFAEGALAQTRRTLADGDPQAQLMGYYGAVMRLTPVGLPGRNGGFEIGGTATYIPSVSQADRTVGFGGTKVENSNLCPVFPRITASAGVQRFAVEAGFTPPIEVCGAKANVIALALGRRFTLGATWDGYARVSAFAGTIELSTTCSDEAVANPLDRTCYGGSPSQDRMKPLSGALEFSAAWQGWRSRRLKPYLLVGVRYERIDFDVRYIRTPAQGAAVLLPELNDSTRLRSSLARVELGAGASWAIGTLRLGGELYYAPGAVLTFRGRAAIALGGAR